MGQHALFSYGFRPFFLLAAAWAAFALPTLLVGLTLGAWPGEALQLARWLFVLPILAARPAATHIMFCSAIPTFRY